ncbi:glycine-rich RNA-binding protein GRP2A-like [Camellia sinensis]|uniref:glycine-rich RNA-binding protein GRP2A-like n=1 Tax=Camellia sinensis TaxID=4442 RepID=UPI0010362C79|nr:glycine-rich RNA-binding protein GRP2A-like [Camellia sinensis]
MAVELDRCVINDRETGRSRGFGFVTFKDEQSMRDAIEGMYGEDLDGRNITVNEAQSRGSGGGGGRGFCGGGDRGEGGYGGGGGYVDDVDHGVDVADVDVDDVNHGAEVDDVDHSTDVDNVDDIDDDCCPIFVISHYQITKFVH